MQFEPLVLTTPTGELVGFAIKKAGLAKFEGSSIYLPDEQQAFNERLNELNVASMIRDYWPEPEDPAVIQILEDPNFMPVEMIDVEVLDEEVSDLVFYLNEDGEERIDPVASNLRYKIQSVPKYHGHQVERLHNASEIIARARVQEVLNGATTAR